jgi:hypothetical protein
MVPLLLPLQVCDQKLRYAIGHLIDDKVSCAVDFDEFIRTVHECAR